MVNTDDTIRLKNVLEYADSLLDGLSKRPLMFAPDMMSCEQLTARILSVRALALGKVRFDWRDWCRKNYPWVTGPVRHITGAVHRGRDSARSIDFAEEIARMIVEERERQDLDGT